MQRKKFHSVGGGLRSRSVVPVYFCEISNAVSVYIGSFSLNVRFILHWVNLCI